jgi:hypothetical protein
MTLANDYQYVRSQLQRIVKIAIYLCTETPKAITSSILW